MYQFSLNNRIIVEAYKSDRSLQSKVSSGFATIAQKSALKGLRVLVTTKLSDGRTIPVGSTAYIREEILHSAPWAKMPLDCETIKGQFFIVDATFIDFISVAEGELV